MDTPPELDKELFDGNLWTSKGKYIRDTLTKNVMLRHVITTLRVSKLKKERLARITANTLRKITGGFNLANFRMSERLSKIEKPSTIIGLVNDAVCRDVVNKDEQNFKYRTTEAIIVYFLGRNRNSCQILQEYTMTKNAIQLGERHSTKTDIEVVSGRLVDLLGTYPFEFEGQDEKGLMSMLTRS
jgi:hypothetical protein